MMFSVETTLSFALFRMCSWPFWIMSSSSSTQETFLSALKKRGKHCAVLAVVTAIMMTKGFLQLISSAYFFSFPTSPKRRNHWCNLIKQQHGKDGLTMTGATVVCREHFRQVHIARKLSGRWDLKKGLWKTCKLNTCSKLIIPSSCF